MSTKLSPRKNGRRSVQSVFAACAVGILLSFGSVTANAYTVNYTEATPAQLAAAVNNLAGAVLTGAGSVSAAYTFMFAWSPWGDTSGNEYLYVGETDRSGISLVHTPGTITYTLGGLHNKVEFLAGSPDNYNSVSFFRGGQLLGTKSGLDWGARGITTQYVTIIAMDSGEFFDEIRFSSHIGAFEFANVSLTAVPLPAAAWLFLSALIGLVALGRRRQMYGVAA